MPLQTGPHISRRDALRAAGLGAGALLLAACGPPPAPAATATAAKPAAGSAPAAAPPVSQPAAPGKPVGTVSVWQGGTCAWCGAIELYNKDHPDTKIELVQVAAGADEKIRAALAAKDGGPDIYQSQPHGIPAEMLNNQLYDLTKSIEPMKDVWLPFKYQEVVHPKKNKAYGIPFQLGVVGVWYRDDILKSVGLDGFPPDWTWEQHLELGRKLKKDKDVFLDKIEGTGAFPSMLWQRGGSYTNRAGTEVTIDDQKGVDVMRMMKRMYDEGIYMVVPPGGEASMFTAIKTGKLAALTDASWRLLSLRQQVVTPEDGAGKWRVTQMPLWEKGGTVTANSGGSPGAVMGHTKNPELAWDFLKFADGSMDGVMSIIRRGTLVPYVPALKSKEFQEIKYGPTGDFLPNQVWADLALKVPTTFYYTPVWVEANDILNSSMPAILRGELGVEAGLKQIGDKIRTANKQYTEMMAKE
jgi:multiple sugar transport system substrate-binding protein